MSERRRSGGMTFAEIGEELGISASGAFSVFTRAMRKLRSECPNALAWMHILAAELAADRAAQHGGN